MESESENCNNMDTNINKNTNNRIINTINMNTDISIEIDFTDEMIKTLIPPKLKRENYDYLPWHHGSFESWKTYVSTHGNNDGLVFGFGLNDWNIEYAYDHYDDLDINIPVLTLTPQQPGQPQRQNAEENKNRDQREHQYEDQTKE